MKTTARKVLSLLMVIMTVSLAKDKAVDLDVDKLLRTVMSSRVLIQNVAKDYLYIGNEVAVTKARKEMAESLKAFDVRQKKMADSLNDPKIKNLMAFIGMNVDEIRDIVSQPYSLDNAAVVIDLAEAISEGEKKIATQIRKKAGYKGTLFKGQRYEIIQIAKYYMAYQAGLKDDVTVRQMNQAVKRFQTQLAEMKKNPENSPKMNQILNRMDKLWKIVHQFYLDIEEGGLPLIVYQTTRKLEHEFLVYVDTRMEGEKNSPKRK